MKQRIYRILCAVLLLVVTTFSWILTGEMTPVKDLELDYSHGNLFVANANIEASLLIWEESTVAGSEGTYKEIENGFIFGGANGKDFVPGTTIPFKIRLKNDSGVSIRTNMTMYIEVPETEEEQALLVGYVDENGNKVEGLFSRLFIEVRPGTGYYGTAIDALYIRFDEVERVKVDGKDLYALSLYNSDSMLAIPNVAQGNDGVELNCSFYFDEEADYRFQEAGFVIDFFRMEQ